MFLFFYRMWAVAAWVEVLLCSYQAWSFNFHFLITLLPIIRSTLSFGVFFRRKKKCIRYMEGEEGEDMAPGSADSVDASQESEEEDDLQDMSSPSTALMGDHTATSPASSSLMPSPGPSLASPSGPPSLLMPSPASLASPLTPGEAPQLQMNQVPQGPHPHRPPVGTNPRDINNPLSVNQLTGQCASNKPEAGSQDSSHPAMVSVTWPTATLDTHAHMLCWTCPPSYKHHTFVKEKVL